MQIENDLIRGLSYASIVRGLADLPGSESRRPTALSIANHVKSDHVPIGPALQRRIIERRGRELGASIADSEDTLVDYVTVSRMIVQRGFEAMQEGKLEPGIGDVLAASKFLLAVDQATGEGVDEQTWRDAMMAYMEVAQQFIPADRWQEYGAVLSRHPVLQAIAAAQAADAPGVEEDYEDQERADDRGPSELVPTK